MPCYTRLLGEQTLPQRMVEVESALKRLERYLATGSVKINIGGNGAVSFNGWNDRADITDVCAYRSLSATNSFELKKAVQRAEATQGRKVNPNAIAAGMHSHDGGKTWSKH